MAEVYRGIIIEENLKNKNFLKKIKILSTKIDDEDPNDIWHIHKVSVEKNELPEIIKKFQKAMKEKEAWYAHFYKGKNLLVVFKDKKFLLSTDKKSWKPAIRYGLSLRIPYEQLDFKPCRIEDEEW